MAGFLDMFGGGGGGGGGISSLISSGLSFAGQWMANDSNEEIASDNRNFQEFMSSTAHQREVDDLRKAGLNPMLTGKYGGSSTPPGASAHMENALGAGVTSGLSAAITAATIDKLKAETANAAADTDLKRSQSWLTDTMVPNVMQQTTTGEFSAANLQSQTLVNRAVLDRTWQEVDSIAARTDLTRGQIELVKEEVRNAVAENRLINAHTGNTQADTLLKQLDIPRARNAAAAEASSWKQNVTPYLKDLQGVTNSAGGLRQMFRPSRGLGLRYNP